jgi:hypothetical protein
LDPEAGLFFAGGKGRVSRNTPLEIQTLADKAAISGADNLIMASPAVSQGRQRSGAGRVRYLSSSFLCSPGRVSGLLFSRV